MVKYHQDVSVLIQSDVTLSPELIPQASLSGVSWSWLIMWFWFIFALFHQLLCLFKVCLPRLAVVGRDGVSIVQALSLTLYIFSLQDKWFDLFYVSGHPTLFIHSFPNLLSTHLALLPLAFFPLHSLDQLFILSVIPLLSCVFMAKPF